MHNRIDECLTTIIQELGIHRVETTLINLIYPPDGSMDFIDLFKNTPAGNALLTLRNFIASADTDQATVAYIEKEATRYDNLSSMGNFITALEIENQKIKYVDTLNKLLPSLKPSASLLLMLKKDWIIDLLFFKHINITQLQKLEKEKIALFIALSYSDLPRLVLQSTKLSMKILLKTDDMKLLRISCALSKASQSYSSVLSEIDTNELAEIALGLVEADDNYAKQSKQTDTTPVQPQTAATSSSSGLKVTL